MVPKLWEDIVRGLHITIDQHGPITRELVSSAAQRIVSLLILDEIVKESPRTAHFLIEMLNVKYPKHFSRLQKEDAATIKAIHEQATKEIAKANQDKKLVIDALAQAMLPNGISRKQNVRDIFASLKEFHELKTKHENLLAQHTQVVAMRGELKARHKKPGKERYFRELLERVDAFRYEKL